MIISAKATAFFDSGEERSPPLDESYAEAMNETMGPTGKSVQRTGRYRGRFLGNVDVRH